MTVYNKKLTDKIFNSAIKYPDMFLKMPLDLSNYLDHFNLPYNGLKYEAGYVKVGDNSIFTQSFTPLDFKKTAFLFHGYFDHTGYFSNVISTLVKNKIRVISWDQPGFGLSTGQRGFCKSFNDYVAVAEVMLKKFEDEEESASHFFIGHSAGCAQIISLIRDRKLKQQDKVIFIAPLVHCVHWKLVTVSLSVFGSLLKRVSRRFKKISSNKDFEFKLRADHLEDKFIDIAWPKAMVQWEKTLIDLKTPIFHTLILQGDLDTTVDYQYNLKWLEEKFSNLEKIEIKGGHHHLHNEEPVMLQLCLNAIEKFIK